MNPKRPQPRLSTVCVTGVPPVEKSLTRSLSYFNVHFVYRSAISTGETPVTQTETQTVFCHRSRLIRVHSCFPNPSQEP
jgi:hypothetical protein